MGLPRLTGISTPLFGITWEYPDEIGRIANEYKMSFNFDVNRKISVFISSICDKDKYVKVRQQLCDKLENTGLFEVYLWEHNRASTLTAGNTYELAEWIDSDVVIFLIDNADGVPSGVQREIDVARKYKMKALFYFCTESSKEKTIVQKQQTGPKASTYKEVDRFENLAEHGFHDLVSDILNIYHYYCKNQLVSVAERDSEEVIQSSIVIEEQDSYISKTELMSLPGTRDKILQEALGKTYHKCKEKEEQASKLDVLAVQLLQVLFNHVDIGTFHSKDLLNELKKQDYSENLIANIELRLGAVHAYFKGNIDLCIDEIEKSLNQARATYLPKWIQNDLLIDLRNMKLHRGKIKGTKDGFDVQDELTACEAAVFYPILDRFRTSFHKKCMEELFNSEIESPYTVSYGNHVRELGEQLAGAFVIAMCHGSLTHILQIYQEMQIFTYYLSCKYDDWSIQRNLLKFAIFNGKDKDVSGLFQRYPKLQIQMSASDAVMIIEFTNNHVLSYQKYRSHLLAIGAVGYFLSDVDFEKWSTIVFGEIYSWLDTMEAWMSVGNLVLKSIKKIQYRIPQTKKVSLIMMYLEKRKRFWYRELFQFIDETVDINELDGNTAEKFIMEICAVIEEDASNNDVAFGNPMFLATLRKQSEELTGHLDKVVKEKLSDFYQNNYLLETSHNDQEDMPQFIDKYLNLISSDNEVQGKNGHYIGMSEKKHRIIRNILELSNYNVPYEKLAKIVAVASDTFLKANESIAVKIEAVELLLYIALRYSDALEQNGDVFDKLKTADYFSITYWEGAMFGGNLENEALELAYRLLMYALGRDEYVTILSLLTKTSINKATEIRCLILVSNYVTWAGKKIENTRMAALFVMYAVTHLHDDLMDVRWHATSILLDISDVEEYKEIVNRQIIELIDSDNGYIKNLIQSNIAKHDGIEGSTKEYVIEKCHNDNNYIVRYVLNKWG